MFLIVTTRHRQHSEWWYWVKRANRRFFFPEEKKTIFVVICKLLNPISGISALVKQIPSLWLGMTLSKYMESCVGASKELLMLSSKIPAGNGETALSFQVTHEQLMECAPAYLQQIMTGVGPKKFKSFHKCVSRVCLVEERERKEMRARDRGNCSYLSSLLSLLTKGSRSTPAQTPFWHSVVWGQRYHWNSFLFELPIIFFKFSALFWYFTSLKTSHFF